jgi:hypothetical protein
MIGAILGGALGALVGGQGDRTSTNGSSSTAINMRDINDLNKGRSGLEAAGDTASMDQFNQLMSLVNAGPGASAVTAGLGATNDYASLLQSTLANGGVANASQIGQANQFASQIFAPQQTALNQQFYDQGIQSQRMAAKLGRPGNDPILANKLAQEKTRQQGMLNSQQGSFAAQYADQLPGRQLDLSSSLMNVRNGLATQAFQNRQTLLTLGQQLTNSERNYRLQSAGKTTDSQSTQTSGGGLAGAISGGLAGFGSFAGSTANMPSFSSMFSSGAPAATPTQQLKPNVGSSRYLTT